ncbi:ferredoxin [Sediminispirochaeta smaragdinae]|uniref:Ferredoxin n=1 Tax=Sediminispirochaeta smaragdinae (strain DSM 11293 / JCM 15392 / SEBR 4228) TaxID=573413 RepID=E1R7Y5_SEDSS|nr:ferredoxin [Sediminispirochaeta smaragdinae]ADK82840.1 putative ferredoxin [Sediminispirochaeta smaragdinae DSM 11293]
MKYRIEIDKDVCIACGLCEHQFPNYFTIGRSHAEYLGSQPLTVEDEVTAERLDRLGQECPTSALLIVSSSSTVLR